ncbi:hypothetical protein SLEP1_g49381 [Rubroshorea leprosula]|uniref:Leucine-rich repeat-containing N-terminal plant-type domain-containing protein n=1 Tax=Rubroshorea leprosula TaxID=152421 RepID=A0AAV5LWX4_9ROSI|nr:hypothetical protein SLEP1_g49381 [Rubroshorea leprosula]
MLSTPLRLIFLFLCLKTAFSSSLHASSFSTTHLCSHEEAAALLQFKTSFSIDYTVCDTKANYSKTDSLKEGIDCCSWDGVSCDNVTGRVIALDLSFDCLSGTFPSSSTLFLLKNLDSLNLAFNDFRLSKIPSEISQFTRLKHLDISYSQFSGQVPAEIAHLPKLVSLNLSNDFYDDSLELILETTTFRNLVHNLSEVRELVLSGVNMISVNPRFFMNLSSSLTTLDLFECVLRGNFPNSIFRFPNLKNFYLTGNGNLAIDLPSSNLSSPLQWLYLGDMDCGRQLRESIGDLKSLQSLSLHCNLEGSIPASIGNLSQLTYLSLSYNNLSGLSSSLANLTQLTSLDLSKNQFSGLIPASISNLRHLTQLTSLDLSNNQFSGPIPASIGNLSQLTVLSLLSNNFNGQIPSSIANLTQLAYLFLSHNQFSGPFPASISNLRHLTQLTSLDLSNNQFSGPIPASISNLRQLTFLALCSNNLCKQIPSSLANLTQLTSLFLFENQFSSPIPASIGNLSQLTDLSLSSNIFNGQIPSSLANLTQLTSLDLSNNQANYFDGNIPFGFPKGCGLQNLNLHGNQMDSLLPRSSVNCRMLEVLDIGNNNISDTFPHWLESLPDLQVLVLRSNKFHGSVQSTKESPSFPKLRVLDLSNNDFLGPLPIRYMENFKVMMDPHGEDGSPEYTKVSTGANSYQYSLVVTWKGIQFQQDQDPSTMIWVVTKVRGALVAEGVVNAGYEVVEQSICILLNGRDFYNYTVAMEDSVFLTRTVNIGATALVTDAAIAIFGEAGVRVAIGVMTLFGILLLTEITPKTIAVHNPIEVARFGASSMAFLDTISSGKNCYLFINGNS